jgi:cobalamin biosynthesis protein CobW
VSHQYDRAWPASGERRGSLVVIGLKGLDRAGVTRALVG